ncbi:hypothetical protein CPARA_3gp445 (nucleomorph) [Cryptomonas paramecium]|uniref:Uncharacterized protein n=1 Tax=Cryptomonas paramaecium TaxID=2898 RepID=F2HI40_9CRYP|nr:hypothetical protein CPARA_3gp445 [Cryptomonas paramecium]AEA39103.1 hypothetical protein CPARA_3gp445 [Cryptomonas paramecium]|mmetsp:Transcript_67660/g.180891  ORF Transcript_67660/g.180891 Transcript_67660/m.180891 type:complete len:164 (+) Transcript_67660:3652-4143(+)
MLNKAIFTAFKIHLFLDNLFFTTERINCQINFKIKKKINTSKKIRSSIEKNNILKNLTSLDRSHNLFFSNCQEKINLLDNLENYVFFFKKITNINFKINSRINVSGFGFIFLKNLIQIFITNKNKISNYTIVKKFWALIWNLNTTNQIPFHNRVTTILEKKCY